MNIILLSGGSGKRLWPLSNETRSKQFLKLLKNEKGVCESMVQRVHRQIKDADINAEILIATSTTQRESLNSQLGDAVDIVFEPERRDTFPAIVLASAYLVYKKHKKLEDVVIVLPVDPYVDLEYFTTLRKMEQLVADGGAQIALMGIEPTYAAERYGYIVPKPDGVFVDRFQEKPNEEYARRLIAEGALWNGGVFAFQLKYLISIIEKYIIASSFEEIESNYRCLPRISFDYEVVEKEKSIAMVKYSGIWRDLGTWNSLLEVIDDDALGTVIMDDTCRNTRAINELDIPVVIMGADDLIVAASPDGILVADKNRSSHLKEYVDGIKQMPMYEECQWGEYRVLEYVKQSNGKLALTKSVFIRSGETTHYQHHLHTDIVWTIVAGNGDVLIEGRILNVGAGDVVPISKGQNHAIRAVTNLNLIEVQLGIRLTETDTVYLEGGWG